MASFAPVAPPQLLRKMRELGDFVIGSYHLLLAHDVVARPHAYEGLFPRGAFIILDNSVIELGKPVDIGVLLEATHIVQPRLVVLPDEIGEQKSTLRTSIAMAQSVELPNHAAWMAVPQGKTLQELKDCADTMMLEIPDLGAWGVGRFVTAMLGSRVPFVRWLGDPNLRRPQKAGSTGFMHLLGFSDDVSDDYLASQQYGVMGIDSAVPVRMGQRGRVIKLEQGAIEPRGDFWENPGDEVEASTLANLYLIRGWFQGLHRRKEVPGVPASHQGGTPRAGSTEAVLSQGPIPSAFGTADKPVA